LSLVFLWDIFGGLLRRTEVCDCVCVCRRWTHGESLYVISIFHLLIFSFSCFLSQFVIFVFGSTL
jgi:hypothetical protein